MSPDARTDVNARKLMDRLGGNPDVLGPLLGILATTYEFDATFFELDLLPACLGLGGWDDRSWTSRLALEKALASTEAVVLLMDGRRYRGRPRSLHLEVRPAIGAGGQLLHAKVLLLVHERAIRLFVGSANLTEAGYRLNREVVLPLMATEARPEAIPLLREVLTEMPQLLAPWWTESAEILRALALERLDRWQLPLEARAAGRFVWSGRGPPLWQTVLSEWPASEPVTSISIVSPFWSEESGSGPVAQLLGSLQQRGVLPDGATLRLFAEASQGSVRTCVPRLPASVLALDVRRFGVSGTAHAVDPTVLPEEVGGRTDFLQRRSLHAKIVLLEGPRSVLAYVGSANFTRSGWGFAGAPGGPNIEAGLLLRRDGRERSRLTGLLPPTRGEPVVLGGAVGPDAPLLEPTADDASWPSFLREARLVPVSGQARELTLVLGLYPERVAGAFDVRLEPEGAVLASGAPDEVMESLYVALAPEALEALLKLKELHVRWWACQEGQRFPINLAPAARLELPLGEVDARLGERLLLAYYQGRVAFADLFPPPAEYAEESDSQPAQALDSEVDTSRIQSYQMREFVDALAGMEDDLRQAVRGTEASMRLALLGPVSPVGLARAAHQAVINRQRSATAGAFQLVEISAAVARVSGLIAEPERRTLFEKHAATASAQLSALFEALRAEHPEALGPHSAFQRYARTVHPDLGRKAP